MAERKLIKAGVRFRPLNDTRLTELAHVHQHLDGLKTLLCDHGVNVIKGAHGHTVGPLSPWHETERALGISEAARKAKLSVLRLEPELQTAVSRLRLDPDLSVADAIAGRTRPMLEDPLAFQTLLVRLTDLYRQLVRLLANLRRRLTAEERAHVRRVLADLITAAHDFEEASPSPQVMSIPPPRPHPRFPATTVPHLSRNHT